MKKKYYFCDLMDDENCFDYQEIVEFCNENNLNQITVFEAKRVTGEGVFYCDFFNTSGYVEDSGCGRFCEKYEPLNGKNGRCKHSKYCYERGKKINLKMK